MKSLYLVQHGKAAAEAEDPARPLTTEGREDVKRVAACVARLNFTVPTICHSGKLRAKQTAKLFAQVLAPASVEEIGGLAPLDDPAAAKTLIERTDLPLMLVGHLPHLSRLVSALTGTEHEVVKFQMGGVVALVSADPGWQVAWMLTPDIARRLGWP